MCVSLSQEAQRWWGRCPAAGARSLRQWGCCQVSAADGQPAECCAPYAACCRCLWQVSLLSVAVLLTLSNLCDGCCQALFWASLLFITVLLTLSASQALFWSVTALMSCACLLHQWLTESERVSVVVLLICISRVLLSCDFEVNALHGKQQAFICMYIVLVRWPRCSSKIVPSQTAHKYCMPCTTAVTVLWGTTACMLWCLLHVPSWKQHHTQHRDCMPCTTTLTVLWGKTACMWWCLLHHPENSTKVGMRFKRVMMLQTSEKLRPR